MNNTFPLQVNMRQSACLLLVAAAFFSSCSHSKKLRKHKDIPRQVALDTLTVSSKKSEYQASAPRTWTIEHSRVAMSFDYAAKTADGNEWLKMHPYFYATDTLVLDAKSMHINSVAVLGSNGYRSIPFKYDSDQIKIKLDRVYNASDTLDLHIDYKAMPYAEPTGGSAAITEDRGLYFINTDHSIAGKPVQIWTQGETESNSHWLPTIDKPNTRFTIQIELTVPDSFQTLANGYMAKSTKEGRGLRKDIWVMDKPIQAYAAMFAVGDFAIIKDQWQGKDVNYYVEHEYAPYARKIFNNTPEMIGYFSDITGVSYPWNKYDQVIVRDYVSGAMENTTASLFGEFMNQNAREIADNNFEDVVSHELFHMWFGDYVTCESWSNITVNESFANYGEQLWRAHKYGRASGDKLAYEDLEKYLHSSESGDPQLVRFYYNDREDVFDRISYEKGGAILNYMHRLMGDSAFYRSMQVYLTKNALHSAEATQWRLAVEEATGQDWNWFFNEWYYHAGHPTLDVTYKYDDATQKVKVMVAQGEGYVYKLPLKTGVFYGDDKTVADWNLQTRKDTFVYAYKNGMRPLIIPDYTHVLPGDLKDDKPMAQWLAQIKDVDADDYISKYKALAATKGSMTDSLSQAIVDLGLRDNLGDIRTYALMILERLHNEKYHDKWKEQVSYIAMNDASNNARAAAFGVLGEWKISSMKDEMEKAVWDSSYLVAGAALGALDKIDSDAAYKLAKEIIKTHPEASLEANTWMAIGKEGNDNDIYLFQQNAPYEYGAKKFRFVIGLYTYMQNVKNIITYEQGLKLLAQLVNNDNIKGYRRGVAAFMFELGRTYDQAGKDKDAQQRLTLTKNYIKKMIDAEKDPSNVEVYNNMMKEYFINDKD